MKPCASGTAKKPRAFSGIEVCNLQLGWTDKFFCDWFRKKIIPSVRQHLKLLDLPQKAVLLLDNASSHPNEDILKSEDARR
jgi:hypothetical protein